MRIDPFGALFKKECRRFLRVFGQTVLTPIFTSSIYFFIFGISLGKTIGSMHNVSYLEFIIPGLIMMGVINHAYLNNASTLVLSKHFGDIEDLKTSPLNVWEIISALTLASAARACLVAVAIFCAGELFVLVHQHTWFFPQNIFLVFFYLLIASCTFGFFGLAVGLYAKSFEVLNAISQFVLVPLIYLGGIFYPLSILPPSWQVVAQMNPIFYYIQGMRHAFLGEPAIGFVSFVVIIAFFVIMGSLAYISTKKSSFKRI